LLQGKLTARRYAAQRHVTVTLRQGETSAVDAALEDEDLARFIALHVPSAYGALVVAARSHLVATVPERTARAMRAGFGLEVFELPLQVPRVPTVMAWHPRHGKDAAHAWLRGCFKRVLGDPDWTPPPLVAHDARVPVRANARSKPASRKRARAA
jgi:DNA-binding transcriptional LysR family regulator